jgi:Flp pilus assembly protein TadG
MRSFRKGESGQILVMTALSMTVLFGCMAIAIDVGLLFNAKRKLQNAVDAAATSAAIDYMFNFSHSTATAAANAAITANGFSVTPTVLFYPNISSAYHNNSDNYVQVQATVADPTFFLGAFQGMFTHTAASQQSVNISASAIAGMPGQGNACVIVLDPHASGAMTLQGSFDVSADSCGVVVDSDNGAALQFTGGGGTLTAGYVSVVGGDNGQTGDSTPTPIIHSTPINNPMPNLNGPVPATDCTTGVGGNTNTGSSYTGTSTINTANGITCFTNAVTLSNFTASNPLPGGILVFENGVTLSGTVDTTAPSSGSNYGSTLDIYGGSFNVNTGSTLSLYGPSYSFNQPSNPTTGWYVPSGIALLQPAANSSEIQVQFGASYGNFDGIVYAPSAELYLQDSGGDHSGGVVMTTDIIVDTLFDKTATLTINSYTKHYGNLSPLTAVALVE